MWSWRIFTCWEPWRPPRRLASRVPPWSITLTFAPPPVSPRSVLVGFRPMDQEAGCVTPLGAPLWSACTGAPQWRSEEHTSELQSRSDLVCRLLLEKKKNQEKRNLNNTTHISQ